MNPTLRPAPSTDADADADFGADTDTDPDSRTDRDRGTGSRADRDTGDLLDDAFLALLRSPVNGAPLRRAGDHLLSDGDTLWPCLAGIPYLRTGRDELRAAAVAAIRAGEPEEALALLLADRKDGTIPAADAASARAAAHGVPSAAKAMESLGYGGLAPYFAHRWCQPTYLSGLALLEAHAPAGETLLEVASGAGHFLREWTDRSGPAIGSDLVFSHLWLTRTFTAPRARLVCFDAEGPFPLATGAAGTAFAHDSFHYFRDKAHVYAEMRRVSADGPVLIGHAHNADRPNLSPGLPLSVAEYLRVLEPDHCYDDAALTSAALDGTAPVPAGGTELAQAQAVAFVRGADAPYATVAFCAPRPGTVLHVNPLIAPDGPRWPNTKFEREFTDGWAYLREFARPRDGVVAAALAGAAGSDPEVDDLARKRVLIDLPDAWT